VVSFLLTTKIAIFAHSKITMLDKLEAIKARFDQVGVALTNPEIINNQSEFDQTLLNLFQSYIPNQTHPLGVVAQSVAQNQKADIIAFCERLS
jgi:hypothetical protein